MLFFLVRSDRTMIGLLEKDIGSLLLLIESYGVLLGVPVLMKQLLLHRD